jgi:hypothetical protein
MFFVSRAAGEKAARLFLFSYQAVYAPDRKEGGDDGNIEESHAS